MKDIPVIKTFVVDGEYYLYDTYSNQLLEVSRDHYGEIKQLETIGLKEYISLDKYSDAYRDVLLLIEKGMMKSSFVSQIEHPRTSVVSVLLDRNIKGITLQVTQNCNFSCRYCLINTQNNIGRTHKMINMSWETAKKSIDYLYLHSKDSPSVTIAFYGGEPMLNFPLIKMIINYANTIFLTKRLEYMMTINGSILTEEMVCFLSENSVHISISLDGPKEIQNKHRKFGKDGSDTYDVVYNNINVIRNTNKEYYDKYVKFIPVMFRDEDYTELLVFFQSLGKSEKDIHKLDVSLNGIDYLYSEDIDLTDINHSGYDVKREDIKKKNIYNDKSPIPSIWHHNGPCIPLNRILVNTEGKIAICEKVESLIIGDIEQGINVELTKKYLNIGKVTEEKCKKCWAMRFCNMCIMNCLDIDNHEINIDRKNNECNRVKNDTMSFFKRCIVSCL